MPKHKPGHTLDDLAFAGGELAESRDRLNKFRDLQKSFVVGSAERAQADVIIDEIETLHQVLDRLCHRLRRRTRKTNSPQDHRNGPVEISDRRSRLRLAS